MARCVLFSYNTNTIHLKAYINTKGFAYIAHFILQPPYGVGSAHPYFTGEKTEAQKDYLIQRNPVSSLLNL